MDLLHVSGAAHSGPDTGFPQSLVRCQPVHARPFHRGGAHARAGRDGLDHVREIVLDRWGSHAILPAAGARAKSATSVSARRGCGSSGSCLEREHTVFWPAPSPPRVRSSRSVTILARRLPRQLQSGAANHVESIEGQEAVGVRNLAVAEPGSPPRSPVSLKPRVPGELAGRGPAPESIEFTLNLDCLKLVYWPSARILKCGGIHQTGAGPWRPCSRLPFADGCAWRMLALGADGLFWSARGAV